MPSAELNGVRLKIIDENSFEVARWTPESVILSDQGVFICLPLIKLRLQPDYERAGEHSSEQESSFWKEYSHFCHKRRKVPSRISYLHCDSHSLGINIDSISISRLSAIRNITAVSID